MRADDAPTLPAHVRRGEPQLDKWESERERALSQPAVDSPDGGVVAQREGMEVLAGADGEAWHTGHVGLWPGSWPGTARVCHDPVACALGGISFGARPRLVHLTERTSIGLSMGWRRIRIAARACRAGTP